MENIWTEIRLSFSYKAEHIWLQKEMEWMAADDVWRVNSIQLDWGTYKKILGWMEYMYEK